MNKVSDALSAFKRGEIVIVTDDDDRENEGDLVMSASHCTSEQMGLFIRHTSGIVCAPMTSEDAKRLNLSPMVSDNDAPHSTAFTVSVDYRHDTTTGISAAERCSTVRALANPNSGAVDFVRPGHIFPLIAKEGGVLMRSGHTEAAIDMCRLSGLPPVGVISELVNDDGSVMKGAEIEQFAQEKNLRLVTVADLIAYRQREECLVERVEEFNIETHAGLAHAISYKTEWDSVHQLAVIYGDITNGKDILVRLHIESVVDDVFGSSASLRNYMDMMSKEGCGVIVYLREGSKGVASSQMQSQLRPQSEESHDTARSRNEEWLEIGMGAQILKDLGLTSIRLLSSRERHYVGLSGFGIEITDTIVADI